MSSPSESDAYAAMLELWIECVRGRLPLELQDLLDGVDTNGGKTWFEHVMASEKIRTSHLPFIVRLLDQKPYSDMTTEALITLIRSGEALPS
jgi:hypothetical protein